MSDTMANIDINDRWAVEPTAYREGLLEGHRILISGGGSGMGRAAAWLTARLGARPVICGRTEEKLAGVVDAIRARGHDADYSVVDIRDSDSVAALFSALDRDHGRIDALINSAGGQFPQPAMDYSGKGWNTVINTNLNGTWYMMQAAATRWRDADNGGAIVNIVVVPQGLHGVAHTRAARSGVMDMSRAVAVEWAPHRIRVNCIAPGAIETEGWAVYSASAREKYPRTNPMMRAGSAWEIAESCVFLLSSAGGFVNGEVLTVDGGGQHWGEIWTTGKPEYFAAATRLWDDDTNG